MSTRSTKTLFCQCRPDLGTTLGFHRVLDFILVELYKGGPQP